MMNKYRTRRAMTFVELMIAISIFSLISIFVSALALAMARRSSTTLREIPAQSLIYRNIDRIRQEILPARYGSVVVDGDGSGITFDNPARGTTSRLVFNSDPRELEFIADTSTGDAVVWARGLAGTFTPDASGKRVDINISMIIQVPMEGDRTMRYSDTVTVRN